MRIHVNLSDVKFNHWLTECDYCNNKITQGQYITDKYGTNLVCYNCFAYKMEDIKVGDIVRVKFPHNMGFTSMAKYTIDWLDSSTNSIKFKGYNYLFNFGDLTVKDVKATR